MSNYKKNTEIVKKYFDDNDLKYELADHGHLSVVSGGIGGFDGVYNSFRFLLLIGDDEVQNYAVFPGSAKEKLPEIAEFITRANHGLKHGAFQLDYKDGEIRYHMTWPMETLVANIELTGSLLALPVKMLHQYSKGIMQVLFGLKTPEDAVNECGEE